MLCSGIAEGARLIIIWHKLSMLVNDNTAEYNVSQEKKYHETIHDSAKA